MKRKRPMPPALKAYWAKRRAKNPRKKRRRMRGKVTITTSRTVRRQNPRLGRKELCVLYAVKGNDRLKYLGGIKFGKKGRAKLFNSRGVAEVTAKVLRGSFPGPLRGFKFAIQRAPL